MKHRRIYNMKEQINLGKRANVHLSELKIEVKEEQIYLYPVPNSSQSFNYFFVAKMSIIFISIIIKRDTKYYANKLAQSFLLKHFLISKIF